MNILMWEGGVLILIENVLQTDIKLYYNCLAYNTKTSLWGGGIMAMAKLAPFANMFNLRKFCSSLLMPSEI